MANRYYTTVGSSGAYQQSQGYSLTPTYYDTSSAAGIAAQVGQYGALEYNSLSGGVALTAIAEGYNPNLVSVASATNNSLSGYAVPITSVRSLSEVRSGIDVAPTFDTAALAQGAALTVPASAMTGGTVTTYVPYGNYAQTELLGTKDIINPISGEIAIYQLSAGGLLQTYWWRRHWRFTIRGFHSKLSRNISCIHTEQCRKRFGRNCQCNRSSKGTGEHFWV